MWIGTCCIGRTVYYTASSAKHFLWHLQSSLCAIAAFHSTLCALTTTDDLYIARLTKAGWGCKYPTQTNSKRLYQQTLSMHTRAYLLVPFPPPLAGMPPVKGTFQSGGSFSLLVPEQIVITAQDFSTKEFGVGIEPLDVAMNCFLNENHFHIFLVKRFCRTFFYNGNIESDF